MSAVPISIPETFSFLCQRQMVKVDSSIYYLDRLKSSLKSGYFEEIFTSGDFEPKYDHVLEIQPKNNEVFPIIVDLIHGKKLIDVLKIDNYVSLLETMDQLEMEIDRRTVIDFVDHLKSYSPQDAKIFELYNFIKKNSIFENLFDSVFKYFSSHLMAVRYHEIFASILLDHLIQIIKNVERPNDDDRYEIVQMCTDWLSQDLENRLPHMATLINSIKPIFYPEKKSDEDSSALSNRLFKTSTDDQKQSNQNIAKCVFAMLAYGENPLDKKQFYCRCRCIDDSDCEDYEDYKYHIRYKRKILSTSFTNTTEEKTKLKRFLENGALYDITVRVGNKAYKLHRSMLESKSGYFADIFRAEYAEAVVQRDGLMTCPNKFEEYLLGDEIDQSTFDTVINYIYLNENIGHRSNVRVYIGVFKTADTLKIDDLLKTCKINLECRADEVNSQDVIELLNIIYSKIEHHDLYVLYLCKHLRDNWPEIHNMSRFCSISFDMLTEIIKSSRFRLDDPFEILDICSKWICHDVKNRYRLLPQISQTINHLCIINCDKFEPENVTDLNNCSQQMVRDKLWEILSSISYMLPDEESINRSTKILEDIPLLIASSNFQDISVLNANLDSIGSFNYSESQLLFMESTSTTMIKNNLFLLCSAGDPPKFQVYNLSSKKHFTLSFDCARYAYGNVYTVLNCNNEVYCCSNNGLVMKYSIQLNRWMILSQHEWNEKVSFTSDGEILYRMLQVSEKTHYSNYVLEVYNFKKKLWSCAPGSSQLNKVIENISQLTVFNGCDLAASTFAHIYLFDLETKKWRECSIPNDLWKDTYQVLLAHCENEIFLVIGKKFYNFTPSNGCVKFRKELPLDYAYRGNFREPKYGNIAFIHRPKV